MKRIILSIATGAIIFTSCENAPKADNAQTAEAVTVDNTAKSGADFKVDVAQSKIEFVGSKPTGTHHGTIMLKDGNVKAENNMIVSGKFTMDMATLKTDDQDAEGNTKLTGHLSNTDFFDVAGFPTATFEIAEVKSGVDTTGGNKVVMGDATHTITGNLTIKNITKSITFPAKVAVSETNITTDASFNIDRTQWELGTVKTLDKAMIKNDVNITLHIVANK